MSASSVKSLKRFIKADKGITSTTRNKMDVLLTHGGLTPEEYEELEEYAETFAVES